MQNTSIRFAVHPSQAKDFDTNEIREHFLIEELFIDDTIQLVYTHYDRFIVGGVKPVSGPVVLETFESLKADYFLERREIGIINVGEKGVVEADGETYELENKEALYVGRGVKDIKFSSTNGQALFYLNSAPAHASYPVKKIALSDADTSDMGSDENANERTIQKMIVQANVQSCQLQMGVTDLKKGSVWNTMSPHKHDRRMEVYFYFNLPENNTISHFMGEPQETRHLWMTNNQAVISPPWSIHCGAGTSNYSFIWGMAGENLDYTDMDQVKPQELK